MIGTGEGSLFGLSLGLTVVYPLESPNNGAVIGYLFGSLTGMILGTYPINPLGSVLNSICHINCCGLWFGT